MAEARTCTTPPSHETVGVRVVALLGLLLAVLLTLPAGAASRHACRRQCSAFLAGCGGTTKQVRRCRRMIIRTCRRAGLAACLQTTTTAGRSTTSTTTMPLLSLVGLVPGVGTASDIVVDGTTHRAYVASREFGLSVVNVSTPSAPMVIGASNPPFYGRRVAVAGTLAVGTAGGLGFRVVGLTRPTAARTVGSLSGTFSGVAFAGTTAYATVAGQSGTDLVVVDLTTPAAPDIVGRVSLGSGGDLRVVGSLAYVAAGSNGLKIVNVTNPNHPI